MKMNLMKYRALIVIFLLAICLFLFNWNYPSNSDTSEKHLRHAAGGGCKAKHE